jgi:pilus assembly protein Flp/PilA
MNSDAAPATAWTEGLRMKLIELAKRLAKDEDGAALLEYTVLLGILLVAVIATITLVGTWISGQWTTLHSSLPTK